MAEPQQPELLPDHQPSLNGAPPPLPPPDTATAFLGTKRQRRPSVRLGEIGEQPAASDAHVRRVGPKFLKPSAAQRDANSKFSSKTRALTNLVTDDCHDQLEVEDRGLGNENFESLLGLRKGSKEAKAKRIGGPIARQVRTNWFPRVDEGMEGTGEMKLSGGEEVGDEGNYREFDDMRREDSMSPLRGEQGRPDRRMGRARVSESRDVGPSAADMAEMDAPSDSGGRDWNNGRSRFVEDGGVRSWLSGLGLGRYAPVFEIHEVDDEVLPLLTLEDLKDMGINAIGSRRKMYCSIQKLRKTFTS